jgi:pimeloyl-ACP methyl ester carboxylesterase
MRYLATILCRSREVFAFAGRARRAANPGARTKRQSRDFLRLVLLALALLACPAAAERVTSYDFPFADPLLATVVGTPPALRAELPERVPSTVHDLLIYPGRSVPEIFWFTSRFRYSLAAQPGKAPLVFVIPGTGAAYDSSKTLLMQRILYKAGLHVLSLTSPVHPNFIVTASSTSVPGLMSVDAENLYHAMQLAYRQVRDQIEVTRFYLTGYSLGATQAAFVAKLDDERGAFGFEKVLLINPPVNLYESAKVLDDLFDQNVRSEADFNVLFNRLMAALSEAAGPDANLTSINEDFLYALYRRNPPSDTTLEALIGLAFRFVQANLSFSADVMTHAGFLVPEEVRLSIVDSLTPYLRAALRTTFADYARDLAYPYYRNVLPDMSFQEMVDEGSLHSIADYLAHTSKIGLMHNQDDIVMAPGDIEFLEQLFGQRAEIYPTGGHVGNLDFRDNVAYIVDFFRK